MTFREQVEAIKKKRSGYPFIHATTVVMDLTSILEDLGIITEEQHYKFPEEDYLDGLAEFYSQNLG